MATVRVNGVELYYEDEGAGDPWSSSTGSG